MTDYSNLSEADTCRLFVTPALTDKWDSHTQIREQQSITDGRVVVAGKNSKRQPPVSGILVPKSGLQGFRIT
jgi:type I restriction enzyme R subunit